MANVQSARRIRQKKTKETKETTTLDTQRTRYNDVVMFGNHARLTDVEMIELVRLYQETNDVCYRNRVIEHNLKLIWKLVRETLPTHHPEFRNAYNEAIIGMEKAFENFEVGHGSNFMSYARWWIKQAVQRYLFNNTNHVKLPMAEVRKIRAGIIEELERTDPTNPELAKLRARQEPTCKIRYDVTSHIRGCSIVDDTIVYDIGSEDEVEMAYASGFTALAHVERNNIVESLLATLPERERLVLELHYGLKTVPESKHAEVTYEAIRKHLPVPVTRERVRQLETKALGRLREIARIKKYRLADIL